MPTDCHMAGRQSTPGLGSDAIIQGVGTMCENHFRSGSTLKAIPCELSRTIPPPRYCGQHTPTTGLDIDTVELTVKTLLSHLVTGEFNSPADHLRTLTGTIRGRYLPREPFKKVLTFQKKQIPLRGGRRYLRLQRRSDKYKYMFAASSANTALYYRIPKYLTPDPLTSIILTSGKE
eukprot:1134898-Pyramimonas_sp.AAC.2